MGRGLKGDQKVICVMGSILSIHNVTIGMMWEVCVSIADMHGRILWS
jgi:hypothetical protein